MKLPKYALNEREKTMLRVHSVEEYMAILHTYLTVPEGLLVEDDFVALGPFARRVTAYIFPEDIVDFENRVRTVRLMLGTGHEGEANKYGFEVRRTGKGSKKRTYIRLPVEGEAEYGTDQNRPDERTAPYSQQAGLEILPDGSVVRTMDPATFRDVAEGIRDRMKG